MTQKTQLLTGEGKLNSVEASYDTSASSMLHAIHSATVKVHILVRELL